MILYQTGSLQVMGDSPMIAYGKVVNPYDERKERIVHYWEKRSSDFLTHKREELHSAMAERWMKEIRAQLPAGDVSGSWMWAAERDFSLFFWRKKDTG